MLNFQPIRITDKGEIEKHLKLYNFRACELGFANLFIWRLRCEVQFCIDEGFLFMWSYGDDKKIYYIMPVGNGDLAKAVNKLIDHAREAGHPLIFASLTAEMKNLLESAMPGRFEYAENRDVADYIYLSESLITLSGKKLHSKRNFINRFYQDYGDRITAEPINPDDLAELREFHIKWCENLNNPESIELETCAILQAFRHYNALGLNGLVLRVGGRIVAFSFGSRLSSDTFDVHVEKADSEYAGAYAVINNMMAKEYGSEFTYMNREEDMGLEGLRKAKLSYQPEIILYRYNAVLKGEQID